MNKELKPFLMLLLILAISCGAARDVDYYSELKELGNCENQFANPTTYFTSEYKAQQDGVELGKPFISDKCFEDLTSLFTLDSSFAEIPEREQKRIIESALVVYSYPLKIPPKGSIFGNAVVNDGTLAAALMCLFKPDINKGCPNYREEDGPVRKFVFNYMLNNIDKLYYAKSDTKQAQYDIDFLLNGRVTFTQLFSGTEPLYEHNYRTPFLRASTVVHEARHREVFHSYAGDTEAADNEVIGAYGFQLGYLAALIHGSYNKIHSITGEYLLSDYDVQIISSQICSLIRDKIIYTNPDLKRWTEVQGCWGPDYESGDRKTVDQFLIFPQINHDASWWLKQNGLYR